MRISALTILFSLTLFLPALAQQVDNPHRDGKERIEAAFIAHITTRLDLSPEQAQKFWPVFNEYQEKRRQLEKRERNLRRQVRQDTQLDAEKALLEMLEIQNEKVQLQITYINKEFKKMLSPGQRLALVRAEEEFKHMLLDRLRERRGERSQRPE